ncbi:MAG: hypothetical protein Fur0035_14210 [Anaerolineales bacterium]
MLKIQLFRTPLVYRGEQPVEIKHRASRALLFYLAAQKSPVSRSALIGLFWPDFDEQKARATLRDYLHKLRHDLRDNNFILTRQETIQLNPARSQVDYLEFESQTAQILPRLNHLSEQLSLPAPLYQQMAQTVNACQASHFLQSTDFDISSELADWQYAAALEVETQLLTMLARLAEHETLAGRDDLALHWLGMGLRLDRLNEASNEKFLKLLLKQGLLARAREHFSSLKNAFLAENYADLPESLQALEAPLFHPETLQQQQQTPAWALRPTMHVPFTGQQELLAHIEKINRRGGALMLFGEAGAGKTRLMREAYQRYASASRLLLAPCQPMENNLPFAPWIAVLRATLRPPEWKRLDSVWARPLTLLLPEIARLRPGLPLLSVNNPEVPRLTMMEAIRQALLLLAERGPLFVFFDDVQWADESSLETIAYLLKNNFFSQRRSLLALASRLEVRNPLLDQFLLTRFPEALTRLEMRPLDEREVAELCQSVLGVAVPAKLSLRLKQDMGGNPLFLLETLQSFRETYAQSSPQESYNFPLPNSVQEVLAERVKSLPPEAQEILSCAAVMGSRLEIHLAQRVVGMENESGVRAVEALERARLLERVSGETLVYSFPHEKIREAVLSGLSPARERLLHDKISQTLAAVLPQDQAARLAYHLEKAGNFARAFDYWILAGNHAYRLDAISETVSAFRHAEHLLSLSTNFSEEQLYRLYADWNKVLFELDDANEIERINQSLLNLGRERGSALLIGAALSSLSNVGMARNQFSEALKYARQAYPYVEKSGNAYELTSLFNRTGVLLYMLGDLRASQEWFVRTLHLTEDANHHELLLARASAYYQMAITETLCGYPLTGRENAQKCLELHRQESDTYGEVTAYSVLSLAGYLMGEYPQGRQAALDGLERAQRINGWRMDGYINAYAGMNEAEMGLLGAAWRHAQKAIEIGRKQGHGEIVGLGCKVLGDLYARLGNHPKAAEFYQQGMVASGEHFVALENMHGYGFALYQRGQRIVGKDFLRTALEKSEQSELWSIYFLAKMHELEILAEEGPEDFFRRQGEKFSQEVFQRLKKDAGQQTLARLEAQLALRSADYHRAIQFIEKPLSLYRKIKHRWHEMDGLQIQARALNALGSDPSAQCLRMGELFNFIEENLAPAPLEDEWRSFRVKFLAQ